MLLCSKLRQLAIVLKIAFLYFCLVFSFPLDVTQLFWTVVTTHFDSVIHIWFKNNEPHDFWLPLYSAGMFTVFLTFHPVSVASYWGCPSWHNAIRSVSNLWSVRVILKVTECNL